MDQNSLPIVFLPIIKTDRVIESVILFFFSPRLIHNTQFDNKFHVKYNAHLYFIISFSQYLFVYINLYDNSLYIGNPFLT